MSARQKRSGSGGRGAAPAPRRGEPARAARRGAGRRVPVVALTMLALIPVLIYLALDQQRRAAAPKHDPALMEPAAAYEEAVRISQQRDWLGSLPYYRRGMQGAPAREWRAHFNYALVLNNITLQFASRAGQQVPLTRSSTERIQYGRAAMEEFWAAVQLAPDGATRAKILSLRANMMVLWGFPWEAFATYRAASHEDSTRTDLRQRGDQFLALMHDPTRFQFVQPDSTMRLATP